jgi:hypothetical protein
MRKPLRKTKDVLVVAASRQLASVAEELQEYPALGCRAADLVGEAERAEVVFLRSGAQSLRHLQIGAMRCLFGNAPGCEDLLGPNGDGDTAIGQLGESAFVPPLWLHRETVSAIQADMEYAPVASGTMDCADRLAVDGEHCR